MRRARWPQLDQPGRAARPVTPCRASSAFTLTELLVVIAILALLAALLLPALANAKAGARRTECISIHKQWASAFHQYVYDNEGWLPREGYHANGEVYWNNWSQVKNATSADAWYNALSNYVFVPPAFSYAVPSLAKRLEFYERKSFFHCPGATFLKPFDPQIPKFSIAMNSQLIEAPNVPTARLELVHNTTQTVLTLDNLLEGETPVVEQQAKDNLGQPASYANRFAGRRHGRTGVMSFVDGHVEAVAGHKVVETTGDNAGWAILPPKEIFWEVE